MQSSRSGEAVASQRGSQAVACMKRCIRNLREPDAFHSGRGREAQRDSRPTMTPRQSDQLIVVRERESRSHGEGADSYTWHVADT